MNSPRPITLVPSHAPPAVTVVEISDPTAVGEGIEVIKQDAVQLRARHLQARRVAVRLGSSLLLYYSSNLPIRTRTALRNGLVAFVAFGPQAAGTANGLRIGPDRILTVATDVEVEMVVAGGYESTVFLLQPDDIRTHLRRRRRESQFRAPSGVGLLQTSTAATRELFAWGRRLVDAAERAPEVFDAPQTSSVAHVEFVETLLGAIGSAVSADLAQHERTRQTHSRLVRAAEDYALTHAAESLYVSDLCQAAGVSERTLQTAFTEIMGMTPVAYLTRLRLHKVRQALRSATPRSTTVTAEALKWGFWHFGDFSKAYKSCFGELPSDTLRRK